MASPRTPSSGARAEIASVDLRRLRYFVAVCDHGGFSRAAAAIGVAQPALTRQIQLLEESIGQPLLERTGRGARPSEPGQFLLDHSRSHLEGIDAALRDLRHAFTDIEGSLTLGICPSIAPFFLNELVAHVAQRHPKLTLSVIKAYSGDLKSLMRSVRIDLALTYSGAAPRDFEGVDLFSEKLVLVGAAGALEAGKTPTLAEAARLRLILPSRIHQLRALIDEVASAHGAGLAPDIELDSLDAVKGLLLEMSAGRFTILPLRSVQAEIEAGALSAAPFAEPAMRRTIALVAPRAPRHPEALAAIRDWILERARAFASR